ncbi:MAG: hypothetical protein ACRDHZ_12830 [Ktedonobacteraceae bacterium]
MTNDELMVVLREELVGLQGRVREDVQEALGTFKVEMREEMRTFKVEMREEMRTFKVEMREEMQSSLSTFRTEIRGEIHATVQASELRMTQRMDQMQKNILEIKGNVALLDNKVEKLDHKVDQFAFVLDETTIKIASMQNDLYNLENKLDTHIDMTTHMKKDIQRIDIAVQSLVRQVFELDRRLLAHIATPWDKAHPGPNPAA